MSASGGSSSNSSETAKVAVGSVDAKYKPIGLDQLSVSLLTDCGHVSKLIVRGYLCRREKTGGGSSGTEDSDDIFVLYWAVLRAKQLFLFPNDDSNQCKEVIVLSQFVYHPDTPTGPPNWPKGFKSASLKSAKESTSCGSNSSGSSREAQHHLGWWPSHYRWHPHIRDQVAKAREDPALALTECRQLLIAAKDLLAARSAATSAVLAAAAANVGSVADFEEPLLPVKKEKAKPGFLNTLMRLRTYSRERSSSDADGGGETSAVDSTSKKQQPPPEPTCPNEEEEEEELYMTLDDPPTGEEEASSQANLPELNKENEETYEIPDEPPPKLPPAVPVKPTKPELGVVTSEMLSNRKPLRPTPTPAPRCRSDDSDTSAAGTSVNTKEGPRQRRPSLSPTPAPRVPAAPAPAAAAAAVECSLKEQVLSGEAVDATVNYFFQAFDCKPQLQDAVSELEAAPVGSFVVHGGSCGRGGHLRLLTLLVRSADSAHPVCRYTIKEAAGGVQITGTMGLVSHSSINQLLYYYHIHDLPLCKGQTEVGPRLVKPLHLSRRTSFLSASVWCLGDKPLGLSLLSGAQDGTFALLVDPQTKQLSLYATADGKQTVKIRINTEGQKLLQRQQKFWVTETEKFDTLEEFLLHYHRHSLSVIAADSGGKQVLLRLATPCQLSEKFQANLQQYLADHVTEEFTEGVDSNGGALVVSTRRLGRACVRTETPIDGEETQPKLTTAGGPQSSGVLVEEARVRGYQWIYRIDGRPEIEFDSLDKLLMYANQHPEKLV